MSQAWVSSMCFTHVLYVCRTYYELSRALDRSTDDEAPLSVCTFRPVLLLGLLSLLLSPQLLLFLLLLVCRNYSNGIQSSEHLTKENSIQWAKKVMNHL